MNMDFNVLDSLNTKMVRPIGSPAHDGIRVPFQLPQGLLIDMHSWSAMWNWLICCAFRHCQ